VWKLRDYLQSKTKLWLREAYFYLQKSLTNKITKLLSIYWWKARR